MAPNLVDNFIMMNASKLPAERIPYIRERMMYLPDDKGMALMGLQLKDPTVALILSIFLGEFGIDRFYIGDTGLGVAKLLVISVLGTITCGIAFALTWIWWLVDCFLIMGATRQRNFETLNMYLQNSQPYNQFY